MLKWNLYTCKNDLFFCIDLCLKTLSLVPAKDDFALKQEGENSDILKISWTDENNYGMYVFC